MKSVKAGINEKLRQFHIYQELSSSTTKLLVWMDDYLISGRQPGCADAALVFHESKAGNTKK
jgi:hypothetical protein